jgi:hypothetical protein
MFDPVASFLKYRIEDEFHIGHFELFVLAEKNSLRRYTLIRFGQDELLNFRHRLVLILPLLLKKLKDFQYQEPQYVGHFQ